MTGPGREGVLAVDKPRGPTSHDVVARARRALGERRIGHTGTLDPFATGLLLLCVGQATRLAEYLTGLDKSYEAVACLGRATDTLDLEGEVVSESEGWRGLERRRIEDALAELRGPLDQVPPQFSAKKVDGVAMHRRARMGETVALEPRRVTVHELELTGLDLPEIRFRVRCSSGTYIRALARDLGAALDVGAHLTALRRTAVGRFRVEDALALDALEPGFEPSGDPWMRPLEALAHLPRMDVDGEQARALSNGMVLPAEGREDTLRLVLVHEGELVAVGEIVDGRLRPRKVLVPPAPRSADGGT